MYSIPTPCMKDFEPKTYMCKRAREKCTVDGDLDKSFWQHAQWTEEFVDIQGAHMPKPTQRTRVKMLWDDEAIYFGAELMEKEIWSYVKKRDDVIFRDNDFEIFIDPDSDTQCYTEFEMNARNTVWDLLLTKAYRDHGFPMNGFDIKGLQTAVKIFGALNDPTAENVKWTCEIKMPFESLLECAGQGAKVPQKGDYFRVNFSRVEWQVDVKEGQYVKRIDPNTGKHFPEDNFVWSPTGIVNMHYPELWGFVFFADKEDEVYEIPKDEHTKWALRKMYYKEHAFYDEHRTFSNTISCDDKDLEVQIQTTSHLFEISAPSIKENKRIYITTDGKTYIK